MARIGSGQGKKQPVVGAKTEKPAGPAKPSGEATARAVMPWARSVHGAAATVTRLSKKAKTPDAVNLPVPDVFDVVTFFRARGEGYARIASMIFREGNEAGALTARELKAWYEGEVRRRAPPKSSAAKRS